VEYLRPPHWFIENTANGNFRLATTPFMQALEPYKYTCTYCKYGMPYKKRTDIWTNVQGLELEMCKPSCPCPLWMNRCHPATAQSGTHVLVRGERIKGTPAQRAYIVPGPLMKVLFQGI
jgi:hypothetical protein